MSADTPTAQIVDPDLTPTCSGHVKHLPRSHQTINRFDDPRLQPDMCCNGRCRDHILHPPHVIFANLLEVR
jgi:hypothetical protein